MTSASMPRPAADTAATLCPVQPAPARPLAGVLIACCLLLPTLPALALESDRHQDMTIESDTSDSDIEQGVVRLAGNVSIQQGSLRIQASQGEIHQDRGSGEIARVILEGTPARMEQALDNAAGHMRASAQRINYDAARDTVVLSGNVRIVEPRGTMTGEQVSYDIARGSIRGQAGAGEGQRVRLVLPGRRSGPADDSTSPADAETQWPPESETQPETQPQIDPESQDRPTRPAPEDTDNDSDDELR